ncbi:MAG: hypothetical protein AAFP77_29450 [Bacteroidota bacterium]
MFGKLLGGPMAEALSGIDLTKLFSGNLEDAMQAILPGLSQQLSQLDRPEAEGGVLQKGENKASYLLMDSGNGPQLSIACMAFDQQNKQLYIARILNLSEAMNPQPQIQEENDGDERAE